MEPSTPSDWVAAGHRHESRHLLDAALRCYLRGEDWSSAARILAHQGRFHESAETLLLALGPGRHAPEALTADQRRAALDAATTFARAGSLGHAVGLLQILGESSRAAALLNAAGRRMDAVRAMRGEYVPGGPWAERVLHRLSEPPDQIIEVTGEVDIAQFMDNPTPAGFAPPPEPEASLAEHWIHDEDTGAYRLRNSPVEGRLGDSAPVAPAPAPSGLREVPEPAPLPGPSGSGGDAGARRARVRQQEEQLAQAFQAVVTIQIGTLVDDRYRIEGLLGAGGMATVFRARDEELDDIVALKVFRPTPGDEIGLQRFKREMKLTRSLSHPNIVRTFTYGSWFGARYISMELLEGVDLYVHLGIAGSMEPEAVVRLIMQAADGLVAAHDRGIIHRDIKPENLFLVADQKRLKIMDFGVAIGADSSRISVTGVSVGTPRYMSPEQIRGKTAVGPASDLYSLGAVMYEMLVGEPVFAGKGMVPTMLCHMTEAPPVPSSRAAGIPPSLDRIVLRLLEKDPADRFASGAELRRALLTAYVGLQKT